MRVRCLRPWSDLASLVGNVNMAQFGWVHDCVDRCDPFLANLEYEDGKWTSAKGDDDARLAIDLGKHQASRGLRTEERHGAIRDVLRSPGGLRKWSLHSIQISPADDLRIQHPEQGMHVSARACSDKPLGHAAELDWGDISAPIRVGVDATARATCKLATSRRRAVDNRRYFRKRELKDV